MIQTTRTDTLQLQGMISLIPGAEGMSQGTEETSTGKTGMTRATATERTAAMCTSREGCTHQSACKRQTAMGIGMLGLTGTNTASTTMAMQLEETPIRTVQELLLKGAGDWTAQGQTVELGPSMACFGGRLPLKGCMPGIGITCFLAQLPKAALQLISIPVVAFMKHCKHAFILQQPACMFFSAYKVRNVSIALQLPCDSGSKRKFVILAFCFISRTAVATLIVRHHQYCITTL